MTYTGKRLCFLSHLFERIKKTVLKQKNRYSRSPQERPFGESF
jgi:hypothetical protein